MHFFFLGNLCCSCHMFCFELTVHLFRHSESDRTASWFLCLWRTNVEVTSRFLPWEHWVQDGRSSTSEMTVYLLPCSKIKLCPYFTYFLTSLVFVIWGNNNTSKKMKQTQNTIFFPKRACHLKFMWRVFATGKVKTKQVK